MNRLTRMMILALAILAVFWAPAARADVSISITISGSIEELLPILRQLQTMGVGTGTSDEDPLKLNVHSVMTGEDMNLPEAASAPSEAAAPAPEPQPEPPTLGFKEASATPDTAKAGESVLFTAGISDPDHVVDTVGLTVGEISFDLFDNGANGDLKAMDGVWSRNYELPTTLDPGDYVAMITAYDVNGAPVLRGEAENNPEPVTTEVSFKVVK